MSWFRRRPRQRDMMRALFEELGGDPEAVFLAYMEAEREGQVERPRGAEDMTPGLHAKSLWQEGKREGWLKP